MKPCDDIRLEGAARELYYAGRAALAAMQRMELGGPRRAGESWLRDALTQFEGLGLADLCDGFPPLAGGK